MKKKITYGIFEYSWSIPVLAEIYNQDGARFVALLNRLGLSRSILSTTLARLMGDDLVMRNPGHGHPLRPEYVLTESGRSVALFCSELFDLIKRRHTQRLIHSKWAFPVMYVMGADEIRFSELKKRLRPITPRALSEELKQLIDEGFLERIIIDSYPPSTSYVLTGQSRPYISLFNRYRDQLLGYW